jgi:hypothetical protein
MGPERDSAGHDAQTDDEETSLDVHRHTSKTRGIFTKRVFTLG